MCGSCNLAESQQDGNRESAPSPLISLSSICLHSDELISSTFGVNSYCFFLGFVQYGCMHSILACEASARFFEEGVCNNWPFNVPSN